MEREVSIDVLGLPEKIVRLLGRNGMKTANDLFAHLKKDYLLSLRGMGRKGLDEIEKGIFRLMESDKELFKYLDNLPRVYMHEPEYIYRRLHSRKSFDLTS